MIWSKHLTKLAELSPVLSTIGWWPSPVYHVASAFVYHVMGVCTASCGSLCICYDLFCWVVNVGMEISLWGWVQWQNSFTDWKVEGVARGRVSAFRENLLKCVILLSLLAGISFCVCLVYFLSASFDRIYSINYSPVLEIQHLFDQLLLFWLSFIQVQWLWQIMIICIWIFDHCSSSWWCCFVGGLIKLFAVGFSFHFFVDLVWQLFVWITSCWFEINNVSSAFFITSVHLS